MPYSAMRIALTDCEYFKDRYNPVSVTPSDTRKTHLGEKMLLLQARSS